MPIPSDPESLIGFARLAVTRTLTTFERSLQPQELRDKLPPRTRAGSRHARYRPGYGRVAKNRIAWLRTQVTQQLAIKVLDPKDIEETPDDTDAEIIRLSKGEDGLNYVLLITIPGRRNPLVWNFSAMTTEELQATRQFFDHLFDLADPVVRERDKVADDAYSKGDDSYSRSYRQLPQLVIREREESADSQGLRSGPEDVSGRHGDDGD